MCGRLVCTGKGHATPRHGQPPRPWQTSCAMRCGSPSAPRSARIDYRPVPCRAACRAPCRRVQGLGIPPSLRKALLQMLCRYRYTARSSRQRVAAVAARRPSRSPPAAREAGFSITMGGPKAETGCVIAELGRKPNARRFEFSVFHPTALLWASQAASGSARSASWPRGRRRAHIEAHILPVSSTHPARGDSGARRQGSARQ